jgi:2-methylcitrate dehydratase PrpD
MTETLLQQVAGFVAALHREPPPALVLDDAARRVRDVIGNSLAASDTEPGRVVLELANEASGRGEATTFGSGARLPAGSAAFVNGTLAHALDFDDTHLPSILHPSASVVPASIAVAERLALDGRDLCTAVAIGDEVCIRLGLAGYDERLGNSVFFERGLHATSICGTIGAAAAAAYLMRLGPAQAGHALGIAVSMGAGILEANRTGGTVKQIHCGWAAHAGIAAADLARLGITGPPTAFEGRFGFLQAYLGDRSQPDLLVDRLGEEWVVMDTFFKPYPANHFTHAVIDCALALREGVRPDQIQRVEIGVAAPVLRTIAEPEDQKMRPASGYAAKFSGPYTFAAAFLGGGGLGVGLDDFTDAAAADPARLQLAGLVRFHADEECSTIYPRQFPAVARAHLLTGESREARVMANRGGPQNPLSDAELSAKFRSNAGTRLPSDRIDRLDAELARLVDVESVTALVSLCTMDRA